MFIQRSPKVESHWFAKCKLNAHRCGLTNQNPDASGYRPDASSQLGEMLLNKIGKLSVASGRYPDASGFCICRPSKLATYRGGPLLNADSLSGVALLEARLVNHYADTQPQVVRGCTRND